MPEATKRASLPRPDGGKVSVLIGPSIRGAMAQLVARLVRNEKVRGSSPLSSTIVSLTRTLDMCDALKQGGTGTYSSSGVPCGAVFGWYPMWSRMNGSPPVELRR